MAEKYLVDWFYNIYFDELYDNCKSTRAYHLALNRIINQKDKKIVDSAIKYLSEEKQMDPQILNFLRPAIAEKLSDCAVETYNEDLMGC